MLKTKLSQRLSKKVFGKSSQRDGFSILELLVAIAIIALVGTLAIVLVKNARDRSRDVKRAGDMSSLEKGIYLYKELTSNWPVPAAYGEGGFGDCSNWDSTAIDKDGDGQAFLEVLRDQKVMSQIPTDPAHSGVCNTYEYRYSRYPNTDTGGGLDLNGCDSSKGPYFVLGVYNMETVDPGGNYPDSPGFSCSIRNWNTELEWVTGGYLSDN